MSRLLDIKHSELTLGNMAWFEVKVTLLICIGLTLSINGAPASAQSGPGGSSPVVGQTEDKPDDG